jgi:hypothetical protein
VGNGDPRMNEVFEQTKMGSKLMWIDGIMVCDESEQRAVESVQGQYFYPEPPSEAVLALILDPQGALASFRLALPEREFYGIGPDMPKDNFEDTGDVIY